MKRHDAPDRYVGLDILEPDQVVHTDNIFMRRAPAAQNHQHANDALSFSQVPQMAIEHIPGELPYERHVQPPKISVAPGAVHTAAGFAGVTVISGIGIGIGIINFEQQPVYGSIIIASSSVLAAAGLELVHRTRNAHYEQRQNM